MSQISTTATSARENARGSDGRFGLQPRAEATGLNLTVPTASSRRAEHRQAEQDYESALGRVRLAGLAENGRLLSRLPGILRRHYPEAHRIEVDTEAGLITGIQDAGGRSLVAKSQIGRYALGRNIDDLTQQVTWDNVPGTTRRPGQLSVVLDEAAEAEPEYASAPTLGESYLLLSQARDRRERAAAEMLTDRITAAHPAAQSMMVETDARLITGVTDKTGTVTELEDDELDELAEQIDWYALSGGDGTQQVSLHALAAPHTPRA